jgi:hypothetical protein
MCAQLKPNRNRRYVAARKLPNENSTVDSVSLRPNSWSCQPKMNSKKNCRLTKATKSYKIRSALEARTHWNRQIRVRRIERTQKLQLGLCRSLARCACCYTLARSSIVANQLEKRDQADAP